MSYSINIHLILISFHFIRLHFLLHPIYAVKNDTVKTDSEIYHVLHAHLFGKMEFSIHLCSNERKLTLIRYHNRFMNENEQVHICAFTDSVSRDMSIIIPCPISLIPNKFPFRATPASKATPRTYPTNRIFHNGTEKMGPDHIWI